MFWKESHQSFFVENQWNCTIQRKLISANLMALPSFPSSSSSPLSSSRSLPLPSETSSLEKTQAMIEVERLLTITMEKVEPWLTSNTMDSRYVSTRSINAVRVRPIPTSMEQVDEVLAVARNLSTRTSAPAGWNPNAPVVGFSTPNPMPHQLRGGVLGALELQRARRQLKAEQDQKKRKRQEEEEKAKKKQLLLEQQQEEEQAAKAMYMDIDTTHETPTTTTVVNNKNDPKAVDAASHRLASRPAKAARATSQQAQQQPAMATTTMNLSDSSSDDDDDDSDGT
ncbi:vitamin-D-receptor interacting mediator subunit 4 domain containing protein [Nitzschia inconspicua]|uniref:Mediator of RNA polymerase II transcription subunit 4 n=1 Tax=Nitzschia inconspicua TaxID=303405 RepID=A0A9K3M0C6_9STRA|nr:vitamin-D-receptor interacting mediator subunit 4 domain containing protein [Nitzschia inconspicua]